MEPLEIAFVCAVIVGMDREQVWGLALDPASSMPDLIFYICGGLIGAAGIRNPRRVVLAADCSGGQVVGHPGDAANAEAVRPPLPARETTA